MQGWMISYHFLQTQVSNGMKELGLTKKIGSAETCQASLLNNLFKREIYWNSPLSSGANGYQGRILIDIDQSGIETQRTNWRHGYSICGICVVKSGHYSKDKKITILLGVGARDPAFFSFHEY